MFKRNEIIPRKDWVEKVESVGMNYHTIDGKKYWNESAHYYLDTKLVDKIEQATTELHGMCMEYIGNTIKSGDYDPAYEFDAYTKTLIDLSWSFGHQGIYGRFDLGIDDKENIKMFEYNADTPTSLLEAAVVQWNWKQEVASSHDQFNSIHEKLIDTWGEWTGKHIYFAAMKESPMEDWGNLHYLMETASEAGLNVSSLDIEEIGWDNVDNRFVDVNDKQIDNLFKLYPWEWFAKDDFYKNIDKSTTAFIEPPWKMLLSNKLLCVKLWEKYPNHPNLLPAFMPDSNPNIQDYLSGSWIQKPLLGREGQGVRKYDGLKTDIAQAKMNVVSFNGIQPVIGSWVIGDESAGIGIREDYGITTNNSCFVPHCFE